MDQPIPGVDVVQCVPGNIRHSPAGTPAVPVAVGLAIFRPILPPIFRSFHPPIVVVKDLLIILWIEFSYGNFLLKDSLAGFKRAAMNLA